MLDLANNSTTACDNHVQAWIGSTSKDGKNFSWTDGTAFDYTSWTQGMPVSGQYCINLWIGQTCYGEGWSIAATQWFEYQCDFKVANAVCKRAPNI